MVHQDFIEALVERVPRLACRKCGEVFDVSSAPIFGNVACPKCGAEQSVPARLGTFLLIEQLGRGGMAAVFRGYDENLGRLVAIKIMRPELSEDPKFVENFLREARAAAQLNHRNVVQIYSVNVTHGQPYIVMELLDGGRLDEMIAKGETLDELRVLEIGIDVAEGLQAANEIGLVHGDVKPANILFDRAGSAKVADFGLARFQSKRKAEKGEIWGTPYYIAPEKVRRHKEDHRSDIYSLGATLYHALGGKPPFDGETATDVVLARLKEPPLLLSDIRPSLHGVTLDLIKRTLEVDPFLRYPTYASLLSDLRQAVQRVRQGADVPAAATRPPRAMWVGIVLTLAVVAGTIYSIVAALRPPGPLPTPPPDTNTVVAATNNVPVPTGTNATTNAVAQLPAIPVQPFSDADQALIAEAARRMAAGNRAGAEETLLDVVQPLPRDHAGRPWLAFLYALPTWFEGDTAEVQRRLDKLVETVYEPQPDGAPDPAVLPQALARVLLGKPFETPAAGAGREWPAWYLDLADFVLGFDALRRGDGDAAKPRWDRYLAKNGRDPGWPYAFQPVARKYLERREDWARLKAGVDARIRKGQGAAVIAELDQRAGAPEWAVFGDDIRRELSRARREENAYQKQQQDAAREGQLRAHREKVQAELDTLDEARERLAPLIARKDFAAARDALDAAAAGLETAEAKATLTLMQESVREMGRLIPFLGRALQVHPYARGRRELGGAAVGASRTGVMVALPGGIGNVEKSWDQVSPRLFAEMIAASIGASSAGAKAKAETALALALYLYYGGAYRPAATYAAAAARLDPDLQERAQRLMPDLLPR